MKRIGHSKPVIGVSFSPNSQLVASASDDKTVKIWNRNGTLLKTLPHTDSVLGVEISPDGKTVASGTWDGNISIWNINDLRLWAFAESVPAFLRLFALAATKFDSLPQFTTTVTKSTSGLC